MSDLIERLRQGVEHFDNRDDAVMRQAADELDRLRGELAEARGLLREVLSVGQDMGGEIELLDRIDAFLAEKEGERGKITATEKADIERAAWYDEQSKLDLNTRRRDGE